MNLASVSVSSEEDWAVISDEFESMTVGDRDEDGWDWCDRTTTPPTTTPSAVNNDRKEPGKESEEDFDLSSLQQPIPIPGGYIHVTYKDMLLKRRRDDDEDNPTVISSSMEVPPKSPWKARIVVQNALPWKRVDREYGIPPPVVYDDDDDFGLEDIIEGEYRMKAHVGMCRVKAVTMMSAKQLEKKQARIAQKPSTVAAT